MSSHKPNQTTSDERSPLLESQDATTAPTTDAPTTDYQRQLYSIAPVCALGVYLAAVDQTIVVSSFASIGSDLHALNLTSRIGTGYMLSLTAFQPLYGKLSDVFGRKACLLFAYATFGLGGLACGLSRSMAQLIAARIFQGVGGGGMTVMCSIVFNDLLPLKERGPWQGFANLVYAVGSASGAPLGGVCSDSVGWRWMFVFQAPLAVVAFVAGWVTVKLPEVSGREDGRAKLERVDFLGAAVLVLATFALLLGLDRGSNVAWSDPVSYGPLRTSLVLFSAFCYVETSVAKEPFVPMRIIFHRSIFAVNVCCFFSFAGWISAMYYMPLYSQAVQGLSATMAGVCLLPISVTLVVGSLSAGYIIKASGRYYWLTVAAYVMLTLGVVPMFLYSGVIGQSIAGIIVGIIISGTGHGVGITSSMIALVADINQEDQAMAIAGSKVFRGLGSAVGLSFSATIVQLVLRSTLEQDLGSGQQARQIEEKARHSLDFLKQLDLETLGVVRHAYALAIRDCYVLIFGFCVVTLISSLFIREKKMAK